MATRSVALLIGVGRYRESSIPPLHGPRNDVALMRGVLLERFGYAPEDIRVLEDEQATRAGVVKAFEEHLIARSDEHTVAMLFVAAHGTQVLDEEQAGQPGDESDALDEAIVVHDSRMAASGFDPVITDDELNRLIAKLNQRTPHVTVVLDTCHSGSGTRALGVVRQTPPPEAVLQRARALSSQRGMRPRPAIYDEARDYVLISASASHEQALERPFDGAVHGNLTWHLVRALREAPSSYTYRDIMDQVKQDVSSTYSGQHAQLEGTLADTRLFGTERRPTEPYITARARGESEVELQAGRVHGVTPQSVYALYPVGSKRKGDGPELMRVSVTDVAVATSRARVLGEGVATEVARAFETARTNHATQLSVFYEEPARSSTLREARKQLADYVHVREAPAADAARLVLREERGLIVTTGSNLDEPLSDPVPVGQRDAASRVVEQVLAWAKWYNLDALRHADPDLVGVELALHLPRGARPAAGQLDTWLFEGERFDIVVTNRSAHRVYFGVLDLESNGAVTLVFPQAGSPEHLDPNGTFRKPVIAMLPDGSDSIRDVVKLIVTTEFTAFGLLVQPALRKWQTRSPAYPESALERLLAASALGATRGFEPPGGGGAWATRQRPLEIVRRPMPTQERVAR